MTVKNTGRTWIAASLLGALGLATLAGRANAAPITDGSNLITPTATVTYDPNAQVGNFGTPGNTTTGAAYDLYLTSDATYIYAAAKLTPGGGGSAAGVFANLYFGVGATASSSSTYGIETTNARSFVPGGNGTYYSTAGTGIVITVAPDASFIEAAIPFTYFETDPQGLGFPELTAANPTVELRLSQSYGYSVAGGASYGPDRLGVVTDPNFASPVPEPASIALLGLGLAAVGLVRRRSRA